MGSQSGHGRVGRRKSSIEDGGKSSLSSLNKAELAEGNNDCILTTHIVALYGPELDLTARGSFYILRA